MSITPNKRPQPPSTVAPPKRPKNQNIKSDSPLPPALTRLERIFAKVNAFCTFCDARLTTSMTMEKIQAAINDVTVHHLAAINVILPDFVHIGDDGTTVQFGKPFRTTTKRVPKHESMRGAEFRNSTTTFIKPETVKKMVDARSLKFHQAVIRFVKTCRKELLDPESHLEHEAQNHMASTPSWIALAEKSQRPPLELKTIATNSSGSISSSSSTAIATTTTAITPHQEDIEGEMDSTYSMKDIVDQLRSTRFYYNQVCHSRIIPERTALYSELLSGLSPEISHALAQSGIAHLYTHQAEAIQGLRDRHHVIVATSTASGKSLIYQLPVLEQIMQDKSSRAMYIFPTKALAQDQMRALQELIRLCPTLSDIKIATFDGDTPVENRASIRANASIIFTNPDMLHHSILPNASQWRWYLSALKYVVVDELHTYNGLFGANVAFIMRRLRRLCWHFGNDHIQFVSCSATIAHPGEHMKLIFGVDQVKLVDQDGAPCGRKTFIIWNPPLLNIPGQPLTERKGSVSEGVLLLEFLLDKGVRTIAFCKLRKTCEMLMKELRETLEKHQRADLMKKVMSYRGGYLPHERRMIERQLFNGELLAVVATNALELGVDIGSLDAVLMIGMPWSTSALWQQSGRAGRRNKESLSVVILDHNPMDQHYSRHPEELFEQPLDSIQFQVEDNKLLMESHLQCAAEELPIDPVKDEQFFGSGRVLREICEEHLTSIGNGLFRPNPRYRPYPSKFVNIRNIVDATYVVIDVTEGRNTVLEEIEESRAPFEIYEGAIFIHQGRTFLVQDCNVDKRYCKVHAVRVDWTTRQRDFTNANPTSTLLSRSIHIRDNQLSSATVAFGKVEIETVVFGYYRIDKRGRIIEALDTYMDPIIRHSTGIWTDIPSRALDHLSELAIDPMASIHGAAHAMISLFPRFTSSSTMDVKTECKSPHATRPRPARIVLYENQPSGIIRQAYQFFDDLLGICIDQIENCPCEDGCPSCVHLAQCSEHNQLCSKTGALIVLKSLITS